MELHLHSPLHLYGVALGTKKTILLTVFNEYNFLIQPSSGSIRNTFKY